MVCASRVASWRGLGVTGAHADRLPAEAHQVSEERHLQDKLVLTVG
jgi:hypothetical protein